MKRQDEIKTITFLNKNQSEFCRYCHREIQPRELCRLTYDELTRLAYYCWTCVILNVEYDFMSYSYFKYNCMSVYINYRFFRPKGSK